MTKYEFVAMFKSLRKLHEHGLYDAALEVIDAAIAEATMERKISSKVSSSETSDE